MDRLDKFTILAIAALLTGSVFLIHGHRGAPERIHNQQKISVSGNPAADLEQAAKLIKKQLASDSLAQAERRIRDLLQKYPWEGEPHMLMGDLLLRKQEPLSAIHEYKQAIEINPDYLDKKTPLFQGKKLKVAAGEALDEIEDRLRQNRESKSLRNERKLVYYLYRKIAGSCG